MDILSRTTTAVGIAAAAAKATLSYYVKGPRCERWPLWFQVQRDAIYSVVKRRSGPTITEETISTLDVNKIAAINKKHDIPTSELPENMGSFETFSIKVSDVPINPQIFTGTGPAEKGLVELTEIDQSSEGNDREITCEITVPRSLFSESIPNASLFECRPIMPNEKIVLYLHGGAYAYGSAASHRGLTGRISGQSSIRFLTINYRLAPLHPFPCQLHDAFIAYEYLLLMGFLPQNIILAGDSAGGNLALSLALLIRHVKSLDVCGLLLISPWVDLISERPSIKYNSRYDYLVPISLKSPLSQARMFYAPGREYSEELVREMAHFLVSPVNGQFENLPPTLIQAGDKELLVDDINELHHNILDANNPDIQARYIYECYPDMIHVFHQFIDLPSAQEAILSAAKFIKSL